MGRGEAEVACALLPKWDRAVKFLRHLTDWNESWKSELHSDKNSNLLQQLKLEFSPRCSLYNLIMFLVLVCLYSCFNCLFLYFCNVIGHTFLGCIVGCRYICNSLQIRLLQPNAMDHIYCMKYIFSMELIILILAFGWLPYAVYNTVTSVVTEILFHSRCPFHCSVGNNKISLLSTAPPS